MANLLLEGYGDVAFKQDLHACQIGSFAIGVVSLSVH